MASSELQKQIQELFDAQLTQEIMVDQIVKSGKASKEQQQPDIPPNPTVIIKNLPYDTDMEDLEHKLRSVNSGQLQFKSFFPHRGPDGNFLGLVFINYRSIADATKAYSELCELDFGSRKARVEYRRLKPGEKPPKDPPLPKEPSSSKAPKQKRSIEANWRLQRRPEPVEEPKDAKELKAEQYQEQVRYYTEVLQKFVDGGSEVGLEWTAPATLSSTERRAVHEAAEKLALGHKSTENEEGLRYIEVTKDEDKIPKWRELTRLHMEQKKREENENDNEEEEMKKWIDILTAFRDRPESEGTEMNFPSTVTNKEKKCMRRAVLQLGLASKILTDELGQKYMTCTKDPQKMEEWRQYNAEEKERRLAEKERKASADAEKAPKGSRKQGKKAEEKPPPPPPTAEDLARFKFRAPPSMRKDADGGYKKVSRPAYVPARQPTGPDGTRGFHSRVGQIANGGTGHVAAAVAPVEEIDAADSQAQ